MLRITDYAPVTRIDLARTILGRGRYWTTAYLIDGLLIDSGCAHSAPELVAYLSNKPLTRLINTHTHEDHIGANGLLQKAHGDLEIFAHPLSLPILENPRNRQPLHPYRRQMWGWPTPSSGLPLADGDTVRTDNFSFEVIYTPGHAPDHICLYEPARGWLFSGDLFVGGKDRALGAHSGIRQIVASLKKIAELPIKRLFPGSARVRENPLGEIQKKIAYLEEMGAKVLDFHKEGHAEAAIARMLFGRTMWIEIFTLGHFSRRNLVHSYLREKV